MKVLHFLDSLNRGGAETLVLDVCRNAKRFGIDLTFAAGGGGDLAEDFENAGIDFIPLQRSNTLDLNLVKKLRNIVKERKIDIVHGYQPVDALHLYLATIGIKGIKRVLSHQGFISGRKNRLAAKYLSPLMDANISVSKSLMPWLKNELGLNTDRNFYLVYNGVDEKRLQGNQLTVRNEFGFSKTTLVMAMVANFVGSETKDQMTICRALPRVFEEFEDAGFIFTGKVSKEGEEYFDKCVEYCNENGFGERVFFTGARDDIPDILCSLDLFVFSSLNEGLPIAVVEAMLTHVPIVVSNIGPLLETTHDGKCAEVFRVKDENALSDKIIMLLKNEERRSKLEGEAYAYASENFSIEAHLTSLAALYSKLLSRGIPGLSVD